jgi:glyoxylase-like metal-dependent hydrolase (beta-lactamase superfamily II)
MVARRNPQPVPSRWSRRGRLLRDRQINRRGKGCLSHVVASNGEAVVVDPMKNIEWFEAFAAQHGLRITRVLDTHIHADHVSGGPALAAETRRPVLQSPPAKGSNCGSPSRRSTTARCFAWWSGGVTIEVRVMHTPGHTPGSTSYLIGGRYLLTGDTVFVTSVGRSTWAARRGMGPDALHHAHRAAGPLPDEVLVFPAHYAGRAGDRRKRRRLRTARHLAANRGGAAVPFRRRVRGVVRAAVNDPPASCAEIINVNLGLSSAPIDKITELELGKNECAASAKRA